MSDRRDTCCRSVLCCAVFCFYAVVCREVYEGLVQQLVPLIAKASGAVELLHCSNINWLDGSGDCREYKAGERWRGNFHVVQSALLTERTHERTPSHKPPEPDALREHCLCLTSALTAVRCCCSPRCLCYSRCAARRQNPCCPGSAAACNQAASGRKNSCPGH